MPGIKSFIAASLWLLIISADAHSMRCDSINAEVFTPDKKLSESICVVATQTAGFMKKIGFNTTSLLHIKVSQNLESLHFTPVYGLYNGHDNKIEIIDLASHLSESHSKKPFGLQMNKELHQSFIAHEISHAYTQANAPSSGISLVAHEYIAYVVQFSLLSSTVRNSILANYKVAAFEDENEMSALYLHLNPEYFAVKSWRHYMSPGNGNSFIKAVVRGEKLKFQPLEE